MNNIRYDLLLYMPIVVALSMIFVRFLQRFSDSLLQRYIDSKLLSPGARRRESIAMVIGVILTEVFLTFCPLEWLPFLGVPLLGPLILARLRGTRQVAQKPRNE